MKTKFFKKLSFVLVVAMVLSLFVPATGAFAAAEPKLNATKKYLHLGRVDNGQNEFNFNIKNKKSGWKYFWESSKEEVAEVNEKNGVVTATGVGKTKITVTITDKDGEEVDTLSATVTVRDNIKEVTIKNPVEKLKVGETHDYNRSFVTESGSTKKTSAITRWTVDSDKADIDDKGVFVATEAGEYTVTALSFQSKARYDAWLDDPVANADEVLDTDETKVVVAGSMVEAKQKNLNTVDVTFDSAMEDVDKNISVYQIVGTTKVKQLVKGVKMDDDKKVASVTLYLDFAKGSTYQVDYPDMESVSFVAATTKAEDVASMVIATTTAVTNEAKAIEIKLFNADGVDITTTELLARVTLKSDGEQFTYLNASEKKVTIFKTGVSTKITATYHTYKYDSSGNPLGNVEAVGTIIGVDKEVPNVTGLNAWTIETSAPNWGDVKHMLAADDTSKRLFVKLDYLLNGETKTTENVGATSGYFEFASSDESILIVSSTGVLFPVKEGSAVVIVKYATSGDKSPVATVTINVTAKSAASLFTLDAYDFSLSNAPSLNDSKSVELQMKDQLDRAYGFTTYSVERLSAPIDSVTNQPTTDNLTAVGSNMAIAGTTGKASITFNADSKLEGVYVYKITVKDISRVVTVTVDKPDDSGHAYYRLQLETASKDLKVTDTMTSFPVAVGIELFSYAANGVKRAKQPITGAFKVEVDAPYDGVNTGNDQFLDSPNVGTTGYVVLKKADPAVTTGSVIRKAPLGSYKVTAYNGTEVIDTQYFTVVDTQEPAVLSDIKSQTFASSITGLITDKTNASLIRAVAGADADNGLKFKVGGEYVNIVAVDATGTADSIAVKSVTVRKYISGTANDSTSIAVDYIVNVGLNMKKK